MSDNKNDKPNLDLIDMVQNARMQHDADAKPSKVSAVYWIEAKRSPEIDAPTPTSRSGEWRLQTDINNVDAWWDVIKQATINGELGYKSKVSTKPAQGQAHPDARIICVRTYDADDSADVERVRKTLEQLGVTVPMSYARDRESE